ncbi:MAG: DUF438 domain-containing protein [Candidatus Acetothermia bacterium]|nr:DUF438 domain-containing protein [Candidatus Acetothermia bacterium]MDH7505255.1 DUF438 domain-containing protein [Candidatus Acetothermia bacterium]
MSEHSSEVGARKETLKGLIKRLHAGEPPEWLKAEFAGLIAGLSPEELAKAEEELIREGLPREEVQRLCDVHLALFKERLEGPKPPLPAGHPLQILMAEHELLRGFAAELAGLARGLSESEGPDRARLRELVHHLLEAESHYLREENVLFPYLERHGITEPPAIMWQEHDKLRGLKRELARLVEVAVAAEAGAAPEGFAGQLAEKAAALEEMLQSHIYKENNILFPAASKVITGEEWPAIRAEFDELGYCCFTPRPPEPAARVQVEAEAERAGLIELETGSFSQEELEAFLNALPVEITFVDKDDTVRYFNRPEERIFTRTKAVLGRKVQQCHPQKSLHLVNQILEDFRTGRREVAEFWLDLKGRLIYIRYFPVWGKAGEYFGCMEVTQDITEIKKIEGEKRLL